MNERRFELMRKEIEGEFEVGGHVRVNQYQEKVINKMNPLQKLSFMFHMRNYDRKLRDIQHIKLV